ncbi:hypothetical protein [Calditerrivibrio nitroreducens]|uniref:Uncharacterized protein n=1 Tax=Calditerrivibrio nitroreducens (strain DSM 19672 / NBRC 101217 / Yu37-1) TaxID=768670 RepID=E4TEX5_CALNY|nr:hypothetical protein [Calditerrivibrio nitroreducens]ADR18381.1 hypothetical protein Calni_0468 [Calditerrivibrio nitroreducens DSM 19672]
MLVVKNLNSEFYDIVSEKEKNVNIELSDYSKLYLMNLLKGLIEKNDFFYKDIIGNDALAEAFMKALSEEILKKVQKIKAVGDLCLIYSGLFPDMLNRKLVDIDYFIQLGKVSFLTLHRIYFTMNSLSDLKNLYYSIFLDFFKLVTVMIEISKSFKLIDQKNLLKVYERWQKTKINSLYEILKVNNIHPIAYQSEATN